MRSGLVRPWESGWFAGRWQIVLRIAAIVVALVCCRLSFCHQLATAGPTRSWSTGNHTYLSQSFAQEWHCSVETSACRPANEAATGVPWHTFVGIQVWALCSVCVCVLLALAWFRRRPSPIYFLGCAGILAIGWFAFASGVTEITPARGVWGIAVCPVVLGLLCAMRPRWEPLPEARISR